MEPRPTLEIFDYKLLQTRLFVSANADSTGLVFRWWGFTEVNFFFLNPDIIRTISE